MPEKWNASSSCGDDDETVVMAVTDDHWAEEEKWTKLNESHGDIKMPLMANFINHALNFFFLFTRWGPRRWGKGSHTFTSMDRWWSFSFFLVYAFHAQMGEKSTSTVESYAKFKCAHIDVPSNIGWCILSHYCRLYFSLFFPTLRNFWTHQSLIRTETSYKTVGERDWRNKQAASSGNKSEKENNE